MHEWLIAPLALVLAFQHASRALGMARAAVELAALCAYGFALEWMAMAVFTSHRYGASWTLAPGGVPLAIAAVWAAVIASAMALAARAGAVSPLHRAALAASFGIALDLMMEPVAVRLGLWQWTPAGRWLGVPIGNFVGWAVIVGGYTFGAERWAGHSGLAHEALRRIVLAIAAIAMLLAVGFVWTRVGAERAFDGIVGWIAWSLLAVAPLLLSPRATAVGGQRPATLATRLADAVGRAPALVFALVAVTFAIDAMRLGNPALVVVAAASLSVLTVSIGRFYLNSFLRFVRALSFGESASSS
jgi:hypothetical protein